MGRNWTVCYRVSRAKLGSVSVLVWTFGNRFFATVREKPCESQISKGALECTGNLKPVSLLFMIFNEEVVLLDEFIRSVLAASWWMWSTCRLDWFAGLPQDLLDWDLSGLSQATDWDRSKRMIFPGTKGCKYLHSIYKHGLICKISCIKKSVYFGPSLPLVQNLFSSAKTTCQNSAIILAVTQATLGDS